MPGTIQGTGNIAENEANKILWSSHSYGQYTVTIQNCNITFKKTSVWEIAEMNTVVENMKHRVSKTVSTQTWLM